MATKLKKKTSAVPIPTAKNFLVELKSVKSDSEREKVKRFFKTREGEYCAGDKFIGVKMRQLVSIAKKYVDMPVSEIEKLLESDIHEARAGAVVIMDKSSRNKNTTPERRKELFDLYLNRHDRINNWDLVDLACLHMVGFYLLDKPRKILYKLAKSKNLWERRTAIVGTCYLIRQGKVDDTFAIAEMLVNDKEDLLHKGVGWMLRFAGQKDKKRLHGFLDKYAATMPRTMLRYSIEKFDPRLKEKYMKARAMTKKPK